jgi:N-dimethylarginine dimethylaminohydrolase
MVTTVCSFNEWGKLREVVIGIEDNTIVADYLPILKWMTQEGINDFKKHAGMRSIEVDTRRILRLRKQLENHVKNLQKLGVKVHRTQPMRHPEEKRFLNDIQRGNMLFGGADFFRVIGSNVILLNSLRLPFRRKQVFAVRPVIEKLIRDRDVRYAATPPPSPHYRKDDLFLENGDIMADGNNIYVGISGNSSSEAGAAWLQQFLGKPYKVSAIKLHPKTLHIDCVCSLTRPGLLTYYPDLVGELPKELKKWDKIKVYKQKGEDEAFGANTLTIDTKTVLMAEQYERVADEYRKRGITVITEPLDATIEYGSGARCLTGVLRRDR